MNPDAGRKRERKRIVARVARRVESTSGTHGSIAISSIVSCRVAGPPMSGDIGH
jgi:hypothetical protein